MDVSDNSENSVKEQHLSSLLFRHENWLLWLTINSAV